MWHKLRDKPRGAASHVTWYIMMATPHQMGSHSAAPVAWLWLEKGWTLSYGGTCVILINSAAGKEAPLYG